MRSTGELLFVAVIAVAAVIAPQIATVALLGMIYLKIDALAGR